MLVILSPSKEEKLTSYPWSPTALAVLMLEPAVPWY